MSQRPQTKPKIKSVNRVLQTALVVSVLGLVATISFYVASRAPSDTAQPAVAPSLSRPTVVNSDLARETSRETAKDLRVRSAPTGVPPSSNPSPVAIPPKWVEFALDGENAVAFGDVLLGRVTDPNGSRYAEPPDIQLWSSHEIPYAISPDVPHRDRVEQTIRYFNEKTPIRFVPLDSQTDGIVFQAGTEHCLSYVGRQGGRQPILISEGCQVPQLLHEVLHALGFIHEHSRTDRDEYVNVNWPAITEKYWPQFRIVPDSWMITVRGTAFDYGSIMIYEPTEFSKTRSTPSLTSKTTQALQPAAQSLSPVDLERLRSVYGGR